MISSFGSLNIALRTLQAMQRAIDITSHNVANAATPHYSRQKVVLSPTPPYSVPALGSNPALGQVGTGVTVEAIHRYRSDFIDSQIRKEGLMRQGWEVRSDILQQIEIAFNEPSDTGLNTRLAAFWAAWNVLATTPTSSASRVHVVEAATDLSDTLRGVYRHLSELQSDLDRRAAYHVTTINDLSQRIAELNHTIRMVDAIGQQANDLRDQRSQLLGELANLVQVDIQESGNSMLVSLGGRLLIMDHITWELKAEPDAANSMLNRIIWADTGTPVEISGVPLAGGLTEAATGLLFGDLGGTLVARDIILREKMGQLDDIAIALMSAVNDLHQTGYGKDDTTGWDFFSGAGARDISVSADILADFNRVASAAAPASPGDGAAALAIARLVDAFLLNGGATTLGDFYRASIAELGQQTQQANMITRNYDLLVRHLETRQEEIAGVSLDEETINLLQYQRTYQAAARVMTTIDEMLDRVINGMGIVGR